MAELTIIIVVFEMGREAPRTISTFLPPYQRVRADTEIIVVDNGSREALELDPAWGESVRYVRLDGSSLSPAGAMNVAAELATGKYLCLVVDGARMASPGLVDAGLRACRLFREPVVSAVAFHLGHEPQQVSTLKGYDRAAEDALLERISWPRDGYRLFEISTFATSNPHGWLGPFNESNSLFLRRELFETLGGMDERFDLPGGGLVNLDFFSRAVGSPDMEFVVLLGEGTFHQVHGGAVSNPGVKRDQRRHSWPELLEDYSRVTGGQYLMPNRTPLLMGVATPSSLELLRLGVEAWMRDPGST